MSSEKGRNDIRPGQHPFSSTGRVEGGSESYEVYGTKGYYKTFQPQFKGRPLKHTEMDFNIDLIGQVIKGYRIVGNDTLVPDEIDLVNDLDNLLTFTSRDMIDAEGNIVYEDDGITPKIEYIWQLIDAGSLSGSKGSKGEPGTNGAQGAQGLQGAQGFTGAQGLTGPKGNTGATGAQGIAGAPLTASIEYAYTYNTIAPTATPLTQTKAEFVQMEGCLILSTTSVNLIDQTNKLLALTETGSFEITFVDQTNQSRYHHFSLKNVYIDTTTFSGHIAFYAAKVNGSPAMNVNPNSKGEITHTYTLNANQPIPANTFFDKWAQETVYVTHVVAPYTANLSSLVQSDYEANSFVTHADLLDWTLESITASWGATTPLSGCVWEIMHVDGSGTGSTFAQYVHPDNTRIHTEILNTKLNSLGTIWFNPDAPDASAEGYTVTLKFVKY